jgi:hypothetical protein
LAWLWWGAVIDDAISELFEAVGVTFRDKVFKHFKNKMSAVIQFYPLSAWQASKVSEK